MNNNLYLTDQFIEDLYNMKDFPEHVVQKAKTSLLDYLGVTLAGAAMIKQKGGKLLDFFGNTDHGLTVIGFDKKANIQTAVLINGLSAHAADFDDGVRFGMMHPGSPIISVLLPLAEKEKSNGKDLLKGIIVGYEAAIRIASAIQPSHKEKGFHATGTCGTIGAALGAAVMLDMNKQQMKNTLSAAATGASGILKMIEGASQLKPYNAGQAALAGLNAAIMAKADFFGPDDVLDGERGFLNMMAPNVDITKLNRNPNGLFQIERTYIKPYAACRHSHAPIEAALNIKNQYKIEVDQIKQIEVHTYIWAVHSHDHTKIPDITSAKMSTPYSVAVALTDNQAGIEQFSSQRIMDKDLIAFAKRIKVLEDSKLNSLVPEKRVAVVNIYLKNGTNYSAKVELPKGEPENPLSAQDLIDKFNSMSGFGGKTRKQANAIVEYVNNVEKTLDQIIKCL